MPYDGTLQFDTRIDDTGYEKGLNSLEKSASTAGNVMKGILGSNLIQSGFEKITEFGQKGIQLASDLEEVQNVVDVTFGEGAGQIDKFAQTASTSFGLTELQAKQFSGTIGAMVKSMGLTESEALDMSTSLVGLTGDMASFYNLDHETAFEKIRSGISGETEPLKQLGINMSVANLETYALTKGIKKAYNEMSEAEKVQLRYGYIMEQTTDAQGDFVRTQDSYANQVRVLQNNIDTMAANVGSMLVPALTSAVGWLNSLFAGPETNETQAAINEAVESLESLDDDVQNIKNNYAKDAIKIQIDYQRAGDLLADYETLKNVGVESATVSAKMQEIAAQLLALYPELEPYIDSETGLLAIETAQVQGLIDEYKDLAIYKLMASKVEAIGGEYLEAVVNMKLLEEELKNAQGELDVLTNKSDAMKTAYKGVYDLFATLGPNETLDAENAVKAADAYIKAFGGLSDSIMKGLEFAGVDIDSIFSGGMLKSADEIMALEGGMETLIELLRAMNLSGSTEQYSLDDDILAAQQSVESAKNAILEFEPVLNEALKEYETALGALNTYAEQVGTDIGTALGEDAADSLTAQKAEVTNAAGEVVDAVQATVNKQPIRLPVYMSAVQGLSNYAIPSHATGLDYVPRDNYLARLHVGESVLRASDAAEWRAGKSGGGGVTAAELTAAMEPVVDAISNIKLALNIDGREFANNQASYNRTALNRYNMQIAKGMGK